jgi:hypothetical protein
VASLLVLLAVALGVPGTADLSGRGPGTATAAGRLPSAPPSLRSFPPTGAAIKRLGVTYGPYLGKRCRNADYRRCELVGLDIVFGHAATRVVAIAGEERIRLRTPGKHNGVAYRDWVGNFTHAGFTHLGNPIHDNSNLVYAAIELRAHFPDGRFLHAFFPHVQVNPGWG